MELGAGGVTKACKVPKAEHQEVKAGQRENLELYKTLIGTYMYGNHMGLGTDHLKSLQGRILKANTGLGIVPIPTNQSGNPHNSWDVC